MINLKYLSQSLKQYLRMPWSARAGDAGEELRQELEFHLTSSAQDHLRSGLGVVDSQQAALERFGDVSSVLKECGDIFAAGQRFWHRVHLATTVALVLAVGVLMFNSARLSTGSMIGQQVELAATGYSFAKTDGDITGHVVGLAGEAVTQANVIAVVKTWPPGGYRQQSYMTTTTADGSFLIEDVYAPDHEYEVQVSVVAEGRLLTSDYTALTMGPLQPYEFKLAPTDSFEIRFESEYGEPISDVAAFPSSRVDEDGKRHQVYHMGSEPIVRHSDEAGQILFTQFLPGQTVTVAVQFPGSNWQRREFVVPEASQVVVLTPKSL